MMNSKHDDGVRGALLKLQGVWRWASIEAAPWKNFRAKSVSFQEWKKRQIMSMSISGTLNMPDDGHNLYELDQVLEGYAPSNDLTLAQHRGGK